jgi:hypothetical protein
MAANEDIKRVRAMGPHAAPLLAKHRRRFRAGEAEALLDALELCAAYRVPLPEWAANEFLNRFYAWAEFRTATLDEAFGVARPKGTHLKARRLREALRFDILQEVSRLRSEKMPLSDEIFEKVARLVGTSYKRTRKIYYETPKSMREMPKNK